MSTNINSTEQIVEINAGDQITNVNIVSQSTTQVISGEQVVTVDVNAGTIPAAWGSITGTLSNQTDLQNALNAKQNNITLTTTGTTGVATLVGATLNIPNYVSSTKQAEWDSAYNDKINSAEVSGTTTKTLTLTQQDGGIIQASWSDFDTAPVTSVFGRTGDVVATEGDYNINQLGDVTITSATNGQVLKYNGTAWVNAADASGLTSVGLEMPSAFTVSGSPLTSNGTITVTGAGTTSQYVRGDGSLAAFPSVSNEAKTLIREVYNKTGATLTKGTVIYIDGGQGNLPTVTKAIATGDPTSAQTFGIVQSDITNMNNGFVVVAGGIDNLDTQAYTEGTALYLSPTTAGAWTSTKPYAPDHMVYLGVVVRSHPTQGVIEVKIQNGVELDEIHDVSARFPVNKDGLFYNSTSGVWENKSIAGVLGYTPVPETRIITINGTAQDLSADRTYNVGTVTSIAASGGTGISVAGSPVTGSGTITITNTAPDQVVGLTGAGTTSISGTYPNFTITSNDQYTGTVTSVAASGGTGISISGSPITSSGTINITNTAPDQIVSLTGAGTTSISGTYPNFTVTSNDQYVGTVTSVNATVPTGFEVSGVPITSSGTVDIKFASGYSLPTNAKQSEWDTAYTKRLDSLTVTGNSGSATLTSNVLNVPTYTLAGLGGEPVITAGTTLQYFRGDKTFQTLNTSVVPESGNVYFTEPRVRSTVLSGLNITGGSISASDSVLNAFGKVQNQINGLIGGSIFQSTWNASTNTPSLASGVGTKGYYYIVSVAGTTNLDGITDWQIGDWAIFDGTVWRKVDNTDAVVSVNGYTGVVSLVLDDLADVSAASPTSNQLLRFNGTSSKWENWTPNYLTTITLTGDVTGTGTSSIATTIGAGKVTNSMLAGSINYSKMDASTVPTWNQDTTGNAATATKLATARTLTIGATGKTFDGSANVSWTLAEIGAQAALTNPVTGTGSSNQIALWNGTNTITGSATLTYSATGQLTVNNTSTATGGIGRGAYFTPTLVAAANNDSLTAISISPTFTNGAFTGVTNTSLSVTGSATFSSTITFAGGTSTGDITISGQRVKDLTTTNKGVYIGNWGGSGYFGIGSSANSHEVKIDQVTTAGVWEDATDVNLILGSNRTVLHSSNYSTYALPLTGGTLTGALNGTTASFNSTATISGKLTVGSTSYDAILLNGGGAGYNTSPIGIYNNNYPNDDTKYFAQYGGNWASSNNWGMGVRGTNDSTIYISAASNGVIDVTKTDFDLQLGAYKAVKSNRELTINGTTYDLSASRTWNVGTVTGGGADTRVAYWTSGSGLSSASNFIWDYTNNRLGIGATSPQYTTHIQSSGEANLAIETNNDSATNFSGFRRFKSRGTPSAKTTIVNGDTIAADGHYAYDGTQYRAVVSIVTQSNGVVATNDIPTIYKIRVGKNDASLLDMISLTSAGAYQLNQLTSNGFVKTSGSNGTLSIDTTTYAADSTVVHLAGTESITGAKTFTSKATFNGTTFDAILLNGGGGNTNAIGIFNGNYPSADDTKYFAQYGGNWASSNNWGMGVRGTNDSTIYMSFASGGVIDVTSTTFNLQLGAYKVLHAGNYNSYALPLTGGTLTGALNGTSATFSGILAESKTADGIIQTIGGNSTKANIYQFSSGGLAGGVFNIGHNFYYDGTNYGQGNAAKSGWVISSNLNADTFSIGRAAAGSTSAPTTILSLASTGAATFSGNILASSSSADTSLKAAVVGDYFPRIYIQRSGGTTKTNNQWSFDIGSNGNLFVEDVTGGIDALIFTRATGAATFSSTINFVGGTTTGDLTFSNYRLKNLGATNQGIFIGNWPGAGYWGLGSTGTAHELRLDQCNTSTGAWENATDINLYLGTKLVLNSANYSSYALPITGGTINSSSTQPLAIYGDNAASNGLFRIQIDEVNDSFGTGTRTFLGDGGIDIFIGTSNSSYTPSNSYIALNQSGEISMGAGSATKHLQLLTTGVFQVNTRVYNAINLAGSSGAANPMGVFVNDYPSNDNTKYYAHYGGNWQSSGNWGMGVNGSGDNTIYLGQAASGVISTAASVNFKIWGNSYAAAFFENSDKRQKELIQDNYIVKGIENISAKYYKKNGVIEIGYFAQELEGLLDSAISKTSDGFLNLSYSQVHTAKIAALENEIKLLKEKLK